MTHWQFDDVGIATPIPELGSSSSIPLLVTGYNSFMLESSTSSAFGFLEVLTLDPRDHSQVTVRFSASLPFGAGVLTFGAFGQTISGLTMRETGDPWWLLVLRVTNEDDLSQLSVAIRLWAARR